MKDVTTLRTYSCGEYETVPVPVGELLGPGGELKLFPEANTGKYFDIDYAKGKLSLRSKGVVGLIPVSETVAVHVKPRVPIANLLYMTWRAGMRPQGLAGFIRGYQRSAERIAYPEELYLRTFLNTLAEVQSVGLLRRYRERDTDVDLRGRLLINPTVTRFRAKGLAHRNAFRVFEHTVDNLENRILKYVIERLVRHVHAKTDSESRSDFIRLKTHLAAFEMVNATRLRPEDIARATSSLIRGLPASHACYEPALWLCNLIATRSGVMLERTGGNRFETLLIDVGVVFENYVRKVCEDLAVAHLGGCEVKNGNKRPVLLFIDNRRHETKPDYYFVRGVPCLALADAKYKRRIEAEDRYEILGFCEALQVNAAAFICPKSDQFMTADLHGTTAGGRKLFIVPIDLGATDFEREEVRFVRELGTLLELREVP